MPYINMLLGPQKPARGQSKQTTKQEESNALPALEEVLVTLRLQVDSCGPSDVSALIQILLGGTLSGAETIIFWMRDSSSASSSVSSFAKADALETRRANRSNFTDAANNGPRSPGKMGVFFPAMPD